MEKRPNCYIQYKSPLLRCHSYTIDGWERKEKIDRGIDIIPSRQKIQSTIEIQCDLVSNYKLDRVGSGRITFQTKFRWFHSIYIASPQSDVHFYYLLVLQKKKKEKKKCRSWCWSFMWHIRSLWIRLPKVCASLARWNIHGILWLNKQFAAPSSVCIYHLLKEKPQFSLAA